MSEEKKSPAHTSAAHDRMSAMWAKMDAILGGTETMRAAGEEYMPKHEGEERDRYAERLGGATLWNQTEITLATWVGKPFKKPLALNDDVSEEIQNLSDDIDQQGTNLDTFARAWFRRGIAKAFCHVLVEYPPAIENEDGAPVTIDQVSGGDRRPYWCLIEPNSVVAARSVIENGKEYYSHFRVYEKTMEEDPNDQFNEIYVERIRVYNRRWVQGDDERWRPEVTVDVYRLTPDEDRKKLESWKVEGERIKLSLTVIPVVTFYADRQGSLLGKSPLQDLADLNVKHWVSQADQDAILTVARFPILAITGVEEPDEKSKNKSIATVISPFSMLRVSEPGAKIFYVEHSGAAIGAGQESLDKLEAQMASYGSEFLKKGPDRQTATAKSLDNLEATSPLQAVTLSFIDAIQQALAMTAKWLAEDAEGANAINSDTGGGTVTLLTEFGIEDAGGMDLAALQAARLARDISRETYLRELKRRGVISEDFDPDKDMEALEKEALSMVATQLPAANTDLDAANKEEESDNDASE